MNSEKFVVGKCPLCGGDVVKTLKGWACSNAIGQDANCSFNLFSVIGNRRISDDEASSLLTNRQLLIDGCATKEGKRFSSIVSFQQDGSTSLSYTVGVCPKCHGQLYINDRTISCGNFKATPSCNFSMWRNIGGHDLTLQEITDILNNGATADPVPLCDAQGNVSFHKIGLNPEMEVTRL